MIIIFSILYLNSGQIKVYVRKYGILIIIQRCRCCCCCCCCCCCFVIYRKTISFWYKWMYMAIFDIGKLLFKKRKIIIIYLKYINIKYISAIFYCFNLNTFIILFSSMVTLIGSEEKYFLPLITFFLFIFLPEESI